MKFVTFKSESNKKKLLISLVVFIVVILAIVITTSLAKYKITQSIPLVSGSISYSPSDIKIESKLLIGDGEYLVLDAIPTSDSLAILSSACTNNASIILDKSNNYYVVSNLTQKGTKCEVIFALLIEKDITNFDYTGNVQTFVANESSFYKIETWGASGGDLSSYTGGKGAYGSGTIYLEENDTLYVYVGGAGTGTTDTGGYNGGSAILASQVGYGGTGGGATDVRTYISTDGAWNNFDSLKSRIMVAAGGGGANYRGGNYGEGNGGAGGTLTGIDGYSVNNSNAFGYGVGTGGTQTRAGQFYWIDKGSNSYPTGYQDSALFGQSSNSTTTLLQTGGGSGYYGGGSATHGGGGGGSSFVSGCVGCNAISEESTSDNIIHTNQYDHYSNYVFSNILMKSGEEEMLLHNGVSATGNTGNGYARFTKLNLNAYLPTFDMEVEKNDNDITIRITPSSDNLFEIVKYYFSINDEFIETTSNTYTFNELAEGDYTLKAYIVDCKNLVSEIKMDDQTLVNGITVKDIIAGKTISTRTNFSTTVTADTTGVIYTAEDDDGISYYYAGAPRDNWVKFAGYYWRIIRINGDGTIRLIYNGTSTTTTGTGTQTTTSTFNSSSNNNAYVGYMYTTGSLSGTGTNSTIKGVLDSWYDSNLTSYASHIDTNAGFCGDRTPSTDSSSSNGSGGTGITKTYYGNFIRYYNSGSPTLKCANSSDLYTKSGASKGNKALTKPIGLINMNEVWLAGGYRASNSSYYLYTGQAYWTMSPSDFSGSYADVFFVYSDGYLNNYTSVDWAEPGVRPVINLQADTVFKLTGSGTSTNPYTVEGAE